MVTDVVDPSLEHVAVTVGRLADEELLPLVLTRARACSGIELEESVTTLRAVHQHHATTADPAHLRIHHALDESAGHRGIDGVAAPPHDLQPDLSSLGLGSDDDGHER